MRTIRAISLLTLLSGILLAPVSAQTLGGCAMFPANNIWNAPIDTLPLSPSSAAYINSIGPSTGLHPDFGSGTWDGGPIGIPYALVPGSQPNKTVTFDYSDESDAGPYPIPDNVPIEGGSSSTGDRHVLLVDTANCILYELYAAYPQTNGTWHAGSGAIFDLKGNQLRPRDWTSADAAGLPILPGLVRYDEVLAGEIKHAIRFTVQVSQKAYLWPARHYASSNTSTSVPPMGARFRLKSSFNVSSFPQEVQVILNAMKKYGIIVADNGSNWYISGVPDERWNNDNLATLRNVHGSDFEAVDESGLMVNVESAQANVASGTALNAVALSPSTVTGGQTTTANTLSLVGAAPSGGVVVALSSSNPGVATVPPTVTVAAGSASALFSVATSTVAVSTQVTISAIYNAVTKTATLAVNPNVLFGVSVSPASVNGGATAQGTATLGGPAPAGGAVVLLSSNSAAATVSPSVTIPAGATSATFAVATSAVGSSTQATISGSYNAVTKTATLTVNPNVLTGVSVAPASISGGASALGTATLGGPAPASGAVIMLTSSSAAATVPPSVTIPAGASSATFAVGALAVGSSTQVTISGSYNGVTKTAALTVLPSALTGVSVAPASVSGGATAQGTATLGGPAPASGAVVMLSSSSAAATVPPSVTIPAGAKSATFAVATSVVATSTQATITATYSGVTKTAVLSVNRDALSSIALSPESVTGGTSASCTLTLSGPAPPGAQIQVRSSSQFAVVPRTVTVSAGSLSTTFRATTRQVRASIQVTISASFGGVKKSATLTLAPLPRLRQPVATAARILAEWTDVQ
jgi:hypothetical protein